MAWRVIVRIGFTGDYASGFRNDRLAPVLKDAGFANPETGTWTLTTDSLSVATDAWADVLGSLGKEEEVLKHLWLYIDALG